MKFRELNLAVFERPEGVNRVLWQPRLDHWYNVNRKLGTLPDAYKDKTLLEIYDDLDCSPRPYTYFNSLLLINEGPDVECTSWENEDYSYTKWETPLGTNSQKVKKIEHGCSWYLEEFPIKTIKDIAVWEYILRERTVEFDYERFEECQELIGDRAEPTIFLPRIPLQRLFIDYIGFENTIYFLHDYPALIEGFIRIIEATDNKIYDIVKKSPIRIINFGDNIDSNMGSMPLFKTYILPYYRRRSRELKQAGKFTHAHWDGNVKLYLKYALETELNGIEALTPLPQGDMTLEEMKQALGEKMVLLDGIPATFFLPHTPLSKLIDTTRRILDMFLPHLILGISDEIPPIGEIERVRLVSEIVANY